MDVDCRRPCHDENYSSLFVENSHPETRPQGVMFHPPWAFVRFTTALRYEPCKNRVEHLDGRLRTSEAGSLYFYTATAVNEINVERPLRHIYELGAWPVT